MKLRLAAAATAALLTLSLSLPPTATAEPTWGGHTHAEWVAIGELVTQSQAALATIDWDALGRYLATLEPFPYAHTIWAAADEYGVSRGVLAEIIRCESRYIPTARNPSSGAAGLGQHLPAYWPARAEQAIGDRNADPFDPVNNARVTAWLLSTQGTAPWAPWSGYCSTAY